MFRGLIDTIVGNLQLSISNIHVRYEVSHCPRCGFSGHVHSIVLYEACVVRLHRMTQAILEQHSLLA
jgi:hypothetical protein